MPRLTARSRKFDGLPEPAQEPAQFYRPAPPIPADEAVEAIQGFSVGLGVGRASTTIVKGQRVHREDPIVKANPDLFQIPARPLT